MTITRNCVKSTPEFFDTSPFLIRDQFTKEVSGMQDLHLISSMPSIRVVPRFERDSFINVAWLGDSPKSGLLRYAKNLFGMRQNFWSWIHFPDRLEISDWRSSYLWKMNVCGKPSGGKICRVGNLRDSRFRWAYAVSEFDHFQTSTPHMGFHAALWQKNVEQLFCKKMLLYRKAWRDRSTAFWLHIVISSPFNTSHKPRYEVKHLLGSSIPSVVVDYFPRLKPQSSRGRAQPSHSRAVAIGFLICPLWSAVQSYWIDTFQKFEHRTPSTNAFGGPRSRSSISISSMRSKP